MTNQIHFTKMHGAGNDYIYVNTIAHPLDHPEKLSVQWSAPHTGIGSDGLVLIGRSKVADFSMRIFNRDGSEAKMCGNASRCIGKYVYEKGLTDKKEVTLETLSGVRKLRLTVAGEKVKEITVDMGVPVIAEKELTVEAEGKAYTGSVVSMGNPHFVIFVEDIEAWDLSTVGPLLENHPAFLPGRTNVELAQAISPTEIRMRVWERGSGITQACGTGACATAVAAIARQKTERIVKVVMDGGPLTIRWEKETDPVYMTGEAVIVYEGTI